MISLSFIFKLYSLILLLHPHNQRLSPSISTILLIPISTLFATTITAASVGQVLAPEYGTYVNPNPRSFTKCDPNDPIKLSGCCNDVLSRLDECRADDLACECCALQSIEQECYHLCPGNPSANFLSVLMNDCAELSEINACSLPFKKDDEDNETSRKLRKKFKGVSGKEKEEEGEGNGKKKNGLKDVGNDGSGMAAVTSIKSKVKDEYSDSLPNPPTFSEPFRNKKIKLLLDGEEVVDEDHKDKEEEEDDKDEHMPSKNKVKHVNSTNNTNVSGSQSDNGSNVSRSSATTTFILLFICFLVALN
ncbi:uncharacterized protein J8A68_001383 [[Candida] subhashii]|uniref:Uncharacterized protein n=1 Tax=[Candida] subhashii TaxID=561895 RepID=A0A8J5V4G0_9ASCO|nr:uncharacterized protein J8A68_001383 [[Candida] subhashii]KAG7665074.1 hypothetical protein J8A68_001383 [[Candida] subhashii]